MQEREYFALGEQSESLERCVSEEKKKKRGRGGGGQEQIPDQASQPGSQDQTVTLPGIMQKLISARGGGGGRKVALDWAGDLDAEGRAKV